MFRLIVILATALGALLTLAWAITDPGFDSWGTFVGAFVAFLMSFKSSKKEVIPTKVQNVSNDAIGLQADKIENVTIQKK